MNELFGYEETTAGVTVRVNPSYLADDSDPAASRFLWSYHIRLENEGPLPVQLLDRHWIIVDARGRTEEVQGDGVVGDQPTLRPGQSYDYVSGCPLATPSGLMHGSYGFVDAAGRRFRVVIPAFALDSPHARRQAN